MCAEPTKKCFGFRKKKKELFIQIDGEDFFTAEEIQERFGLSRTVFFQPTPEEKDSFPEFTGEIS